MLEELIALLYWVVKFSIASSISCFVVIFEFLGRSSVRCCWKVVQFVKMIVLRAGLLISTTLTVNRTGLWSLDKAVMDFGVIECRPFAKQICNMELLAQCVSLVGCSGA
ncbi:hypothetical protein NPIL_293811 [Nephila pilipes]|uniref:Uncharacterized protein n=1 Tax=Nephila pilipes TaxID=299642 RepID=A0A8X6Q0D9_NEPPI|nr:hypothetical protein NPIL_293811 [Nephila pilipes]